MSVIQTQKGKGEIEEGGRGEWRDGERLKKGTMDVGYGISV